MLAIKSILILSAIYLAITEIIDEVTASAAKVSTLGMQGLLAFMLVILFIVIWYQEKKRTADRTARDIETDKRFNQVISHHETSVSLFNVERAAFTTTLISLNEKSIKAMEAMTITMEGFKDWLQDRAIHPQTASKRKIIKKSQQSK